MTDLEKVARAIYAEANKRHPNNMTFDELPKELKLAHFGYARAAVESLREPSEAMKDATCGYPTARYDTVGNEFRDMIDAILNEKP